MLTLLLIQTLIAPALLAAISVYLMKSPFASTKPLLAGLLLMHWVLLSAWIIGLPNVMPIQASDWFWLTLLFTGVVSIISHPFAKKVAMAVLFIIIALLMHWTLLHYQASFNTHSGLWLEFIVVCSVALTIIYQADHKDNNIYQNSFFAFTVATMGFAALISGSITLALLCFCLASLLFFAAIFKPQQQVVNSSTLLISLLLLLQVRHYAEVPLLSTLTLLGMFSLSSIKFSTHKQHYFAMFILACLTFAQLIYTFAHSTSYAYR
ncbi:hypothetical protein AADZ91_09120 [Colwelliaceae bacterium 6441]